jgi:hypothetical protein
MRLKPTLLASAIVLSLVTASCAGVAVTDTRMRRLQIRR